MKILVVGSGGREHALAWKLRRSPLVDQVYCAPGNAGIHREATPVEIGADEVEKLADFAAREAIDLTVVGPELPLVLGIGDLFERRGLKVFGPNREAARLEGSKAFAKELMLENGIPTAACAVFTDLDEARKYVDRDRPCVVKADGLAAGKGVAVCSGKAEAQAALDRIMGRRVFGAAGDRVVVEEMLVGEEASFTALMDGGAFLPLASAQDHKRVFDDDQGPNTGGMGACSPAPAVTEAVAEAAMARIVRPAVAAMAEAGTPFKGVLYAGLMVADGAPRLLEFNVRFGDPECQALMVRLDSDLLPALVAAADGVLDFFDLRWRDEAAVSVVMAARGYPGAHETGGAVGGLDRAAAVEGVTVFHAATEADSQGVVRAAGGRVLGVTAAASGFAEARARAYRAVDAIDWPGGFCRRDVGAGLAGEGPGQTGEGN